MKNLKDTILEKLKVDDIIPDKEKFPINGTIDDMIEFLKEEDFKEVKYHKNYTISEQLKKTNDKVFLIFENTRIWFVDTSKEKISEKNPIFYIDTESHMYSVYVNSDINIVEDSKIAFLNELNKHFGWQ